MRTRVGGTSRKNNWYGLWGQVTAIWHYGGLRATPERQGQPIDPLDTLIAAHALACNAILVTNNTKEFARVSALRLENWA